MPFRFCTCAVCRNRRLCRVTITVVAEEEVDRAWVCEICDEENNVQDWPATPSEAHDE